MLDRLLRWMLKRAMRIADRMDRAIDDVWNEDDG